MAERQNAWITGIGLASSLGGTLQMMVGAVMIAIASPFLDGSPRPMVVVIAICALIALALALTTLQRRQPAAA